MGCQLCAPAAGDGVTAASIRLSSLLSSPTLSCAVGQLQKGIKSPLERCIRFIYKQFQVLCALQMKGAIKMQSVVFSYMHYPFVCTQPNLLCYVELSHSFPLL